MPSKPPADAPARWARKIGNRGKTQGDEMESTPAKKAAIKETSTPMGQPYHCRLGAAIAHILFASGIRCFWVCARGRDLRRHATVCQRRPTLQLLNWVVRSPWAPQVRPFRGDAANRCRRADWFDPMGSASAGRVAGAYAAGPVLCFWGGG